MLSGQYDPPHEIMGATHPMRNRVKWQAKRAIRNNLMDSLICVPLIVPNSHFRVPLNVPDSLFYVPPIVPDSHFYVPH